LDLRYPVPPKLWYSILLLLPCHSAQNTMFQTWLIAARAVQGLGGGGIFQMV
jgi:hypothetical protein